MFGRVHADLMGAAGLRPGFDDRFRDAPGFEHPKMCFGFVTAEVKRAAQIFLARPHERGECRELGSGDCPVREQPVFLQEERS